MRDWERPETVRRVKIIAGVILALLVLGDFFVPHHAVFGIEGTFGFYSVYGFFGCAALLLLAKAMGLLLKRKDTYYDDD